MDIEGYSQQDATDIIMKLSRYSVQVSLMMALQGCGTARCSTMHRSNGSRRQPNKSQKIKLQLLKAEAYYQNPQELAADLIGYYLMSPQQAKQLMPKATKLVRDLMNSSKVATFYSMPLASLVAAIFANMLVAEGEEEDQQAA